MLFETILMSIPRIPVYLKKKKRSVDFDSLHLDYLQLRKPWHAQVTLRTRS